MIWTHKTIQNTIINYTNGSKRTTGEKLNIGRWKVQFCGLYALEE
jgi:hypothetical protein